MLVIPLTRNDTICQTIRYFRVNHNVINDKRYADEEYQMHNIFHLEKTENRLFQ